jgi:hypothetical protein
METVAITPASLIDSMREFDSTQIETACYIVERVMGHRFADMFYGTHREYELAVEAVENQIYIQEQLFAEAFLLESV